MMDDAAIQGHDEDQAFEWGDIAFHAGSVLDVKPERRETLMNIQAGMAHICLLNHGLAGLVDSFSSRRTPSDDERDSELRTSITGRVFMTAYLYPEAKRVARAIEIANELDVPVFVVYHEDERSNLPFAILELPNIQRALALGRDPRANGDRLEHQLGEVLDALKLKIRAQRTSTAQPAVVG